MGSLAYPATKLEVENGAMGSLTYPAPKLEVENGAMGKSLYGQRCGAIGCSATSTSCRMYVAANSWRRAHIRDSPVTVLVMPASHETCVCLYRSRRIGCLLSKEFALSDSPKCMQRRLRRLLPRLSLGPHGRNLGMFESLA